MTHDQFPVAAPPPEALSAFNQWVDGLYWGCAADSAPRDAQMAESNKKEADEHQLDLFACPESNF